MRVRHTKTCGALLIGISLCTVAFLAISAEEAPKEPSDRLSFLIQAFMDVPAQATADALVHALDNREASAEQGNEILSVLMAPRAVVRSAYSMNKSATYVLTYPVQVHFRNMMLRRTRKRFVNGVEYDGGGGAGSNTYGEERTYGIDPHSVVVAGLLKGMSRTVLVVDQETIDVIPEARTGWQQSPAVYSCTSRVYIPIHFVPEQAAESVHVFTSPDLDEKMQSAFSTVQYPWGCANSKLKTQVSGTTSISYQRLPADVAFKMMFRDEQGRLLEIFENTPQSLLKAYAGTSRKAFSFFSLNSKLGEFPLAKGRHEGYLVLVACPDGAYSDPRLINIWGGTLEFAVTLSVDAT
jgi:hypothetical protein